MIWGERDLKTRNSDTKLVVDMKAANIRSALAKSFNMKCNIQRIVQIINADRPLQYDGNLTPLKMLRYDSVEQMLLLSNKYHNQLTAYASNQANIALFWHYRRSCEKHNLPRPIWLHPSQITSNIGEEIIVDLSSSDEESYVSSIPIVFGTTIAGSMDDQSEEEGSIDYLSFNSL